VLRMSKSLPADPPDQDLQGFQLSKAIPGSVLTWIHRSLPAQSPSKIYQNQYLDLQIQTSTGFPMDLPVGTCKKTWTHVPPYIVLWISSPIPYKHYNGMVIYDICKVDYPPVKYTGIRLNTKY
jgi:hypothetical protein